MIHRNKSKNEKYEYLELRRKCRIKTIDYIENNGAVPACGRSVQQLKVISAGTGPDLLTQV